MSSRPTFRRENAEGVVGESAIMQTLHRYGPLVGRMLIALVFVVSGINKLTGFDGAVGYIVSKGLPMPALGATIAIIVELGGGLMLVFGYKARWAGAVMFVFAGATAVFFHDFWAVPADQAQNMLIHFMKNVSMMGGLLYVVMHGSGPVSVDGGK